MKISKERLNKLAHSTTKILDLFFKLVLILTGIVGIVLLLTFYFSDDTFIPANYHGVTSSITIDGMISYKIDPTISLKPFLQVLCPTFIIMGICIAIIIRQLSLVLETIQKNSPFDEKNPDRLTAISIVLLIGSIFINLGQFLVAKTVVRILEIPNIIISYKFNLELVLLSILILILAGVFKYGTYLQNEYDATL